VQRVESALPAGEIDRLAERVASREIDPYAAIAEIIASADAGRTGPSSGADASAKAAGRPETR
jgi:hypothetical protein